MSLPIDETITPDAPHHSSIEPESKSINDLPEELLIHVLSMVSPEHRCRIRRVSRKWYTLGYHIEPLVVRSTFSAGGNVVYSYGRLEISTPYYHQSIKFKVNPLFYHHFSLSAMEFKTTGSRRELLLRARSSSPARRPAWYRSTIVRTRSVRCSELLHPRWNDLMASELEIW